MKKTLLFHLVLILFIGLQLSSCKKEKEEESTTKLTITVKLDGDKVEGALVSLYDEDVDLVDDKTTNSQGKVVFDDLDPGTYEAEVDYTKFGVDYYGYGIYEISKGQNKKVTIVLTEW